VLREELTALRERIETGSALSIDEFARQLEQRLVA